jgi:tetratricopeptide (TPR) repeat protein
MLINKNKADQEPYLFQSALLFIENEEHELAIEYLIKLIEINPLSISAHELLNKMYWEQSEYEHFLLSYKNSILKYPKYPDLYFSYIAMCLMACKYSEARQALSVTYKLGFNSHQFIHLEGVISVKEGDLEKALLFFDKALSLAPNFVRYSIDKANILIQKKEIALAEKILRDSQKLEPYNQEVIGYLGLCWKLLKHPKLDWLLDYNKFICVSKLETPNGYSSFHYFWEELKSEIRALHISTNQPLDQSVRNGTQTSGMLHVTKTKAIQDYQNALHLRICEYLADLPRDLSHPFLARNTQNFYFSGSWSVKLGNNGYHSNHLHPKSWLSTCTYINVPDNINCLDSNKSGWLNFGESNLSLGNTDKPALEICPEEGLCVIFPAYFWHGTNPIKTKGVNSRLTALCDIEPLFG